MVRLQAAGGILGHVLFIADMTSHHPLIEAWEPHSPILNQAADRLFEEARLITPRELASLFNRQEGLVEQGDLAGMEATLFTQADPHVDPDEFGRWFVLWVARADGQILHGRRTTKEIADPVAHETVKMLPGQVVILDSRRLHWTSMNPPLPGPGADDETYRKEVTRRFAAAVVIDCPVRPTRAQAEAHMEALLAKCEWTVEQPVSAPSVRTPRYGR